LFAGLFDGFSRRELLTCWRLDVVDAVRGFDVEASSRSIDSDIDGSIDDVDGSFVDVDGSFDDVDGSFDDVDGSFDDGDGSFDDVDGSFDEVDGSFDDVDGSFDDGDDFFVESQRQQDAIQCTIVDFFSSFFIRDS